MKYQILQTLRLFLRAFTEADFEAVSEYASDFEVVRYMALGSNKGEETKNFLRNAEREMQKKPITNYQFAAIEKNTKQLVGAVGLEIKSPLNREGEIGYCLNKRYWNKGYATELAQAIIDFGFGKEKLHRIFAICRPENIKSQNVLKKAGLKQEGHLHEHLCVRGRWEDSLLFSILENEWQNNRSSKAL